MSDWQEIRKSFELIEYLLKMSKERSSHTYIRARDYLKKYGSYRYSEDYDTIEKWVVRKESLLESIRSKNDEIAKLRKENKRLSTAYDKAMDLIKEYNKEEVLKEDEC